MGRYREKTLERLDLVKMHLDKLTKWVQFDRVSKEENIKMLNDSIKELENIENLVEIDK